MNMVEVLIRELDGFALDWAVAQCQNLRVYIKGEVIDAELEDMDTDGSRKYSPTTNWAQSGPIIDKENIILVGQGHGLGWKAAVWDSKREAWHDYYHAETPLVAAMRCYVASVYGDRILIPAALEPKS